MEEVQESKQTKQPVRVKNIETACLIKCIHVVDTRVKEDWLFWVDTSIVKRIVWMTG